jgi:hypothetical protein
MIRVSAFAGGVLTFLETTQAKNLVGPEPESEDFLPTMAKLGDRLEFPSGHTRLARERDDDLGWWADLVGRYLQIRRGERR